MKSRQLYLVLAAMSLAALCSCSSTSSGVAAEHAVGPGVLGDEPFSFSLIPSQANADATAIVTPAPEGSPDSTLNAEQAPPLLLPPWNSSNPAPVQRLEPWSPEEKAPIHLLGLSGD